MASLPENPTYANPQSNPLVPGGFKYTPTTGGATLPAASPGFKYSPSTTYQYLSQLKSRGSTGQQQLTPPDPSTISPGTPEYDTERNAAILQYGNLLNKGQGVPTETSFLPPTGDSSAPIPVPQDYGTFMAPQTIKNAQGESMSWGTPLTPVIQNIQGDVPGQYVEDTSNPNLLVKTNRGANSIADQAIHDGRPGFMYQIDHIMPLELGGADTLANRELLTSDQNDAKTKAQAVPYTLYAHGQISLSQARDMAMQWKNRDLTDLPEPNGIGLIPDSGGKTGIQIAQEVSQRWAQPPVSTLKDKIGQIPQFMKDLGKGFLPDSVREFIKGAASGVSLGFLPYQQGANEGIDSKIAGIAGMALGGLGSFILGGELIDGALALGGVAAGAFDAYRGAATAETIASGLGGTEAAATLAEGATAAEGAVNTAKVAETTFKSLNKAPGYLQGLLNPETMARAAKFGATSALVGQGQQFVANKFNPYTLSGKGMEKDQGLMGTIGNMTKDFAMGAAVGIMPANLKGTAYAMALPLTLGFIANPDDPTSAITNGIIFGSMHALGTFNEPGYNNVEMLGGKPYENPSIKAFEETTNKAAYASLAHYAPDIYPALGQGETVPVTAHDPATVQQAKNVAIENVWQRFFFGKDASPEVQNKTLADFKNFSQNVEKPLDAEKPEVKGLDKLSLAKRKAANTELKAQNAEIKTSLGKGYQTQNAVPGDTANLPDGGMDLQTALTEVKRITAASRQLYKGGLAADARNLADVNDLLSFGKVQLQGRFDAQEKYVNPPIAKQAVNSIDDSFMKNSFNNSNGQPSSGTYPVGDAALTGAALNVNQDAAKYFFQQKSEGNASPNILLVDRSDTAPLWRMRNTLMDAKDIAAKNYAPDPNPENALQAFGVVKDAKTGAKSLVPLGWMASDFRLNEATGAGHEAFNVVAKKFDLKPLDLSKDDIVPAMRKQGVSVLVANLDPRATLETLTSKQPFIPVNLNDQNWEYSKTLGTRLQQQENQNPISMEISKVANAVDAKSKSAAISEMNKKIEKPASEYIPKPDISSKNNNVATHSETTRSVLKTLEKSLDVASPSELKTAFQKNLGMILPDSQASEVFNNRNNMVVRDGIKLIVDAVNSGNVDVATRIKSQFVKTYLESGILQSSDGGKVVPDMKILGKMNSQATQTPQPIQGSPDVNKPLDINNYTDNNLNRSTVTRDTNQNDNNANNTAAPEPNPGLSDRIVSAKKFSTTPNNSLLTPKNTESAYDLAKNYIPAGINALEDAKVGGPGYTSATDESVKGAVAKEASIHDSIISGVEKQIQSDLQGKNVSPNIIDEVKNQVRTALEGHSEFILGPDATDSFGKNTPIPKPTIRSQEFYKFIDDGLAKKEQPAANYFAKTFDEVFKKLFGDKYKNKIELAKVLSTITREGSGFWNDIFFNDTNAAGREIQQNKDIVNARASGDRTAEMNAYSARRQQLLDNPTNTGGGLSKKDMANIGLESGQISKETGTGMRVIPWYQDDNMVGNLTQGENLMAGAVSGQPSSGASAVRDVKRIFIGAGKDSPGLLQYMNKLRVEQDPGAKKLSIPSSLFDNLEKEAEVVDTQKSINETSKINKANADKQEIEKLKSQADTISNMIKGFSENPDEPLPAGLTPKMLQENLSDISKEIKKFSGKKDGGGGPGIDNSFLTGNIPPLSNGPTDNTNPNMDRYINAIAQVETGGVKGNRFAFSQPSGNPKYGNALGQWQVTEASLQHHSPSYLGSLVSSEDFLNSPELQHQYQVSRYNDLKGKGFTPQQMADSHRYGTTKEKGYNMPGYVNRFNAAYNYTPPVMASYGNLVSLGK